MLRAVMLAAVLTAVFWFQFSSRPAVYAQDRPELLIVHQNTRLHDSQFESTASTKSPSRLRAGTAVVGIRQEEAGKPARSGWQIATLEAPPRYGWASASAVTPYATRGRQLKATAVSLYAPRPDQPKPNQPKTLPELIKIQGNSEIKQAWREVVDAFSKNEKLPEAERLPEPYFARAEIWTSANNYVSAIDDYVEGIKYARKSDRDILTYSRYFDKLQNVAEKLQSLPVPARGVETNLAQKAQQHFNRGCSYFFSGKFFLARESFDNALQLAPAEAGYWYFRALAQRASDDPQRAQHDALMGSYFERKLSRYRRRDLNRTLMRVQGAQRVWLDSYRLGSPTNQLLRDYGINLVTAANR